MNGGLAMMVYYSECGRTYHYYHDCHHLQTTAPDTLQTAGDAELNRDVCVCANCQQRRSFSHR